MSTQIHTLTLGVANCYLIMEQGTILIDAGVPNQGKKFLKQLESLSIEPTDISLIVITHGHWDHIGSLAELKRLTGSQAAVNEHEKDWVEHAQKPNPPGIGCWGKIFSSMGKLMAPFVKLSATSIDISLGDTELDLGSYGVQGKVVHTPGHSPGSSSVVLETGDTFVGDLVMNGFPRLGGPGMPVVGDAPNVIKRSWQILLDMGAKTIYPGHGKPFQAEELAKQLSQ